MCVVVSDFQRRKRSHDEVRFTDGNERFDINTQLHMHYSEVMYFNCSYNRANAKRAT
jgi:hypothetical protein